jgi:hypothetical protein
MRLNIAKEVAAMRRMTMNELRARYAEAFGERTNANNRVWLIRRIAWRLQALSEGDLSERARRRAEELANDADLRLSPPKVSAAPLAAERTLTGMLQFKGENRLPPPGSVIVRHYKGEDLQVKVLADGFEFEGQTYRSLSAVAKAITGSHCNGYHFFRIGLGQEVAG